MWGSARWEADAPSARSGPEVTDEDLQAQAWLPSCLNALLAEVRLCSPLQLWLTMHFNLAFGPPLRPWLPVH